MLCGAEGCTGVHKCRRGNYAERCPRIKRVRGVPSRDVHARYNASFKGALRDNRYHMMKKEARLHGSTD